MTLAKVPTAHAVPYGTISLSSANFGTTIDRESMAIREYTLPNADARLRRLALARDGTIFYTDYARGYLGTSIRARES
jgi:virginiamycin B lyase